MTKDEVDELVSGLIQSGLIKKNDRSHLLLQYLLDEELAERGGRLKAYSIAIDVFKRSSDFNPAIDSAVRVEMLRLRRAIKAYSMAAPASSLMVEFDKGSYRPRFYRIAGATAPRPRQVWHFLVYVFSALAVAGGTWALSMLVLSPKLDYCSVPTLTVQLIVPSTNEEHVFAAEVRSMAEAFQTVRVLDGETPCANSLASHLSLRIERPDTTQIIASVTAGSNASTIWAQTEILPKDASADDILIALGRIVFDLASADGVLMVEALQRDWPSATERRNVECLRKADAFLARDDNARVDAENCLAQATSERISDSRLYGANALVIQFPYLRERKALPPDVDAHYQRLVERALDLNPLDTRALTARLREYRRAVPPKLDELNRLTRIVDAHLSGYPQMLHQAAMVEGYYLGRWPQADAMIERARSVGGPNPDYQYVVTGARMMNGDWEGARVRLNVQQEAVNSLEGILMLAVGAHLSDPSLIERGRQILSANGQDDAVSIKTYIDSLHYEPGISDKLYVSCRNYYDSLPGDENE